MEHAGKQYGVEDRTVVFTDIADSTSVVDQFGDTQWFDLIAHHHRCAENLSADLEGSAVASTGDGVLTTFSTAAQGREFALGMLRQIHGLSFGDSQHLGLCVGMATGSVHRRRQDYFGRTMHVAARLSDLAEPGQTLLDATSAAELSELGLQTELHGLIKLRGLSGEEVTFSLEAASDRHRDATLAMA